MKRLYLLSLLLVFCIKTTAAELPDGIITLDKALAKNFSVINSDGQVYELKSSRGKWVFLHFWASWCGPCRREMPIIEQLTHKAEGQAMDIVLINTAEDEDTIFTFLGSVSPELHSYMDPQGELTEIWQPRGLPTTFFIDPSGHRRYLALGGRDWLNPSYQNFIKTLLAEKH